MGLFGGGKPSGPKTTKDLEKDAKKAKKEQAASTRRRQLHKHDVKVNGDACGIPFENQDE